MRSLCLLVLLSFCFEASAQDHLEPEEGILNQTEWQWNHAKRLREVLLKNAADYHLARMVSSPAFEPEWVVTVVREEGEDFDSPPTYYVEHTGADKNLFRTKESRGVKVSVSRAPLDRMTAESLNKTWYRMLRKTRYPRESRLGADGVGYHFSRFVPTPVHVRSDQLPGKEQGWIWTPDEESPSGKLVAIGTRLKEYAKARPEARGKVRAQIRVLVDDLDAQLARLDRKEL